jgi:hypothetical protein
MRRLAGTVLALFAVLLALPSTPEIKFRPTPPTEASIRADIQAEKLQRQYDLAENQADRVFSKVGCTTEFSELVAHAAVDERLPARLIAAVVVTESTCDPSKISRTQDVGLMQVNRKVWKVSTAKLLNPAFNVKFAAHHILAPLVHTYGIREGLHRYNGLGNPSNEYSEKVMRIAGFQS